MLAVSASNRSLNEMYVTDPDRDHTGLFVEVPEGHPPRTDTRA